MKGKVVHFAVYVYVQRNDFYITKTTIMAKAKPMPKVKIGRTFLTQIGH